jgi:hypothetical protein
MNEYFGFKVKGPIGQVQIWTPSLITWHGGCNPSIFQPNVNHLGKFKLHPTFNKHLGLFYAPKEKPFFN